MHLYIRYIVSILLFINTSCEFKSDNKKIDTFYDRISDWDISYIPIIEPYRASSIDGGKTWTLNKEELNSVKISEFAVSDNTIFGKGGNSWFLFDTKSKLYAEYYTEKDLFLSLENLQVLIKPTATCKSYFDSLAKGKPCYWFPKEGKNYPDFPSLQPNDLIPITIFETPDKQLDFKFNPKINFNKTRIYYFKIYLNIPQNELYYVSIDNSRPVLAKDSVIIPVFTYKNEFEISLYTPYPVPQEIGIPEDKRYLKSKIAYIR